MALSPRSISSLLLASVIGAFPFSSQAEKSEKSKLTFEIQVTGKDLFQTHSHENRVDTKVCGNQRKPQSLIFKESGALKNVVAFLEPMKGTLAAPTKPIDSKTITISNCEFSPRIVVISPGAFLLFKSTDNILFQIRSQTKLNGRKQVVLPPNLQSTQIQFNTREIVPLVDDIHPWMRMYAIVEDKRIVELSNEKGEIIFRNLNPGIYNLSLWHETLGFYQWETPIDIHSNSEIKFDWKITE